MLFPSEPSQGLIGYLPVRNETPWRPIIYQCFYFIKFDRVGTHLNSLRVVKHILLHVRPFAGALRRCRIPHTAEIGW